MLLKPKVSFDTVQQTRHAIAPRKCTGYIDLNLACSHEVRTLRRIAQIIQLHPEAEAAYIDCHKAVWPSVLATIAACNIRNYTIFLRAGVLFATFEYHGTDYTQDMQKMAADPETQRWWKMVDPMQAPMSDSAPGEKWSELTEVFHVD